MVRLNLVDKAEKVGAGPQKRPFDSADEPDWPQKRYKVYDPVNGSTAIISNSVQEDDRSAITARQLRVGTISSSVSGSIRLILEDVYRQIHEVSAVSSLHPTSANGQNATQAIQQLRFHANEQQRRSIIEGVRIYEMLLERYSGCALSALDMKLAFNVEVHRTLDAATVEVDVLGRIVSLTASEMRLIARYYEVAAKLGWMMLSILNFSARFHAVTQTADDGTWNDLLLAICVNFGSIEMFAKSRRLPWIPVLAQPAFGSRPLIAEQIRSQYDIPFGHPHEWYLSLKDGPQLCKFQGQRQTQIDECVYRESVFARTRPADWPSHIQWPQDPTKIRAGRSCRICGKYCCNNTCGPHNYLNPLIEIIEFPGMGRGVRALQRIPAGSHLAEYVGRILNAVSVDDTVYSLTMNLSGHDLAIISSAVQGNWTRYINHSCRPNTVFEADYVGGRQRQSIFSARPIEMFEVLTIDYGDGYWHIGRLCQCGEPSCQYGTPGAIRERQREARMRQIDAKRRQKRVRRLSRSDKPVG